jgi:DNA-binding response OmpR family regulator
VAFHDDAADLQTIEEWLAGTEFELLSASGGDELQTATRTADAILCDWNGGDEHGVVVLQKLRSDGVRAPVFVISADRSRQSVVRSIAAGACEYLVKPLDRDLLLAKLRQRVADV